MINERCPQKGCNAPARLLFSLVCANPNCRNYDSKWHIEAYSEPRYTHITLGEQVFLGGFVYDSTYYDLYFSLNCLDDSEWVEARYGNELSDYIGEEVVYAELSDSKPIVEAARRWNNRMQGY
jgi:hypothetical protein